MATTTRLILATLTVAFLLGACNDEKDDYVRPTGRGSAACQAWQKSICDFVVKCSNHTEEDCVDNYYGITCLSDEQAQSCATALASASCATPPSNCDLTDIADRAPAVTACNTYIDAMCQRTAECSAGTVEACKVEAASALDCSLAIAYATSFETCISEVGALACTADDLPETCVDAIKLSR
jgi:hypothetical protein